MADILPIKKHREYYRQAKRSAAGCLRQARGFNPTEVVIVGWKDNGDLFVLGEPPSPQNSVYLLEQAKAHILRGGS